MAVLVIRSSCLMKISHGILPLTCTRLQPAIVKTGDDLRQECLAYQLLQQFLVSVDIIQGPLFITTQLMKYCFFCCTGKCYQNIEEFFSPNGRIFLTKW